MKTHQTKFLLIIPGMIFCILFMGGCKKHTPPDPTTSQPPQSSLGVVHGGGYLQAAPNDWVYVYADLSLHWDGGMGGGLHVQRIEWDDNGKTTKIDNIPNSRFTLINWRVKRSR
jgi:hypothetical protein